MLVQPNKLLIIRTDPLKGSNDIVCDAFKKNCRFKKELGRYKGTIDQAFAHFANKGIITTVDWIVVDEKIEIENVFSTAKKKLMYKELYYGTI